LTLSQSELDLIAAWADRAEPLSGVYFRSVSYSFMKPETVLDGAGAAAYGGRFASRGTAAVYLSESDAVATSEVTGRKKRVGGAVLIDVEKYPRVVFAISFELARVLDLSQRPLPRGIGAIRDKCLGDNLSPSQQFGDVLVSLRVEGLLFPIQAGPRSEPHRLQEML
jgi:RES domain-containing protein